MTFPSKRLHELALKDQLRAATSDALFSEVLDPGEGLRLWQSDHILLDKLHLFSIDERNLFRFSAHNRDQLVPNFDLIHADIVELDQALDEVLLRAASVYFVLVERLGPDAGVGQVRVLCDDINGVVVPAVLVF